MESNYRIDPQHIWELKDERIDLECKALLNIIVGLQNMDTIHMGNKTFAQMMEVSEKTIIRRFKTLTQCDYILERVTKHRRTNTKITRLNKDYLLQKILGSCDPDRRQTLINYYRNAKYKVPRNVLHGPYNMRDTIVRDDTWDDCTVDLDAL